MSDELRIAELMASLRETLDIADSLHRQLRRCGISLGDRDKRLAAIRKRWLTGNGGRR
jgi:hypothetical protein